MPETFNYWEKELSGIMTAGSDDRVKLQIRTAHTATKWLSLTPEDFEAVEALLVERYAARLAAEEQEQQEADPKTSIVSLTVGESFAFHPGNLPCTYMGSSGSSYSWQDYQGIHRSYAGTYAGTGQTAWPFVYPLPEISQEEAARMQQAAAAQIAAAHGTWEQ